MQLNFKHNNRYYHHHYGGQLGTGGGSFNKVFDLRYPKKGTPFLKDGVLCFGGPFPSLLQHFSTLSQQQLSSIHRVTLSIPGNKFKQSHECCIKSTVFLGLCMCFLPLLLFKCNCYNRYLQALYEMPIQQYQQLASLLAQCPNLKHVLMYIQDSRLNERKTRILQEGVLGHEQIGYFWITNCVHGIDLQEQEYGRFDELFRGCRQSQRIVFHFHWDDKHFQRLLLGEGGERVDRTQQEIVSKQEE